MADLLIGGYGPDSGGEAAGISLARSGPDGVLEVVGLAAAVESPSWLLVHGGRVYAALEVAGQVASLRRTATGLELDGVVAAGGDYTCSLVLSGGRLLAANYGNGVVGVLGLDASGAVTGLVQTLENEGSGPHPDQGNARAHAVYEAENGLVISLDLGTDQALLHRWRDGLLVRVGEHRFPAGTGPRDIARHPSGRLAIVGELDSTVHLFELDGDALVPIGSAKLEGAASAEKVHAAGLVFSPDGRFGYVSLRGPGLIGRVEFTEDGLRAAGSFDAGGPWVRHLAVEGDLLHAANQHTNELTTFRIGADGDLVIVGATPAPSPAFIAPLLE